jgi:hypothetical protein
MHQKRGAVKRHLAKMLIRPSFNNVHDLRWPASSPDRQTAPVRLPPRRQRRRRTLRRAGTMINKVGTARALDRITRITVAVCASPEQGPNYAALREVPSPTARHGASNSRLSMASAGAQGTKAQLRPIRHGLARARLPGGPRTVTVGDGLVGRHPRQVMPCRIRAHPPDAFWGGRGAQIVCSGLWRSGALAVGGSGRGCASLRSLSKQGVGDAGRPVADVVPVAEVALLGVDGRGHGPVGEAEVLLH